MRLEGQVFRVRCLGFMSLGSGFGVSLWIEELGFRFGFRFQNLFGLRVLGFFWLEGLGSSLDPGCRFSWIERLGFL